jgi:SAM-dependent methyltransferase
VSTRWNDADAPRGDEYDARWSQLAAAGQNVHGEADLVEELLRETGGTRVLDAGCGTGRVAIELHRRGFRVVGVDADSAMLETARRNCADIGWIEADLTDLGGHVEDAFDVVVLAGNVMIFLRPGTEAQVLQQVADRLEPGAMVVAGFQLAADRLPLEDYDTLAARAGLGLVARWSTWDRAPYAGGDYAVSVHRRTDRSA